MRITSRRISALFAYAVATALAIVFVVPLMWVLSSSFKSDKEIYTVHGHFFPVQPTLSHYLGLVSALPQFPDYMLNSAIVTVVSVSGVVLIAGLAGYPLARYRFPAAGPSYSPSSCLRSPFPMSSISCRSM